MIDKIIETAMEAGREILNYYSQEIEVIQKEDNTPLTQADLASQKVIINALQNIDPETPVISEEAKLPKYDLRKNWESFWLVDPLDGTKEFIKKMVSLR